MHAIFRFVNFVENCRRHSPAASVAAAGAVEYIFLFEFLHAVEDLGYFIFAWLFYFIVPGKIAVAPVIQALLPVFLQNIVIFFMRVVSRTGNFFFQFSHAFLYGVFKRGQRFLRVPCAGSADTAFFAIKAVNQQRKTGIGVQQF